MADTDNSSSPAATAGAIIAAGVPEGLDARVLATLLAGQRPDGHGLTLLHVARDDRRAASLQAALAFFAPDARVLMLPAWDCVPYDRVSPSPEVVSRRIATLATLALAKRRPATIVVTTVNAMLQRVPGRAFFRDNARKLAPGQRYDLSRLARRLEMLGYGRTGTVMEHGEFALRGGIVDVFPPGRPRPLRLDFFGDTLESIKQFDPQTQRSAGAVNSLLLLPRSELVLGEEERKRFRQRYVAEFGAVTGDDPLYEAVSAGMTYQGMEHWLSFFHDGLETVFEAVGPDAVSFDHQVDEAATGRLEQISEHYGARRDALQSATYGGAAYHPLPPGELFLSEQDLAGALEGVPLRRFNPFNMPDAAGGARVVDHGGRPGRRFVGERALEGGNVYEAASAYIETVRKGGRRVVVAAWSNGSRERLAKLFADHGLEHSVTIESWPQVEALDPRTVAFVTLGLEQGFETRDLVVIGEQDLLGDRLVRQRRVKRKASDVINEATSLSVGDYVVHTDHGIGRFAGLRTIEVGGAPHDCLELHYHGGDKLFLPVENIELLTRYGSDAAEAQLDRLGGAAWQSRKARLKQRIREIAAELVRVAAKRALKSAPVLEASESLMEEFAARFPHEETDDQLASFAQVAADLAAGRPMDRLICGDVGFGKTEVALRAAFLAVMSGKQVAVVVPTTLLARQHYRTFSERYAGTAVTVAQASRLVGAKEMAEVREKLGEGKIDIVVGTHALLAKGIEFRDLGLLIIDEEQHFGVQHKERLKQLRDDVHVLTLTATPIPRTLQLALSGVRELSLITTPPVDRLAVRTYVSPFDPVILREALLREHYRGGQSFYVCPRIADLEEIAEFLRERVPELKFITAHGQMAPGQLDDVMNAFYDRQYEVLLSTTIIESGLDIPSANTLIVHKAHMFGLAQLYQLRGRVGRSKRRAYAYFTLPPGRQLTEGADRRLKVLQSLDTLGAGFTLASHDLDIRGGGNLLGEEQSGQIKEVGFELYQSMVEEAIASMRSGDLGESEEQWSPQIALGTAVLIPEEYVPDLQLRLGLYRRLSSLGDREAIDDFASELIDRFGPLPKEVRQLLEVVEIKSLCRRANVSQIDAGPKGATFRFRNNRFTNPAGLLELVARFDQAIKLQPDHKLVYRAGWETDEKRLAGVRAFVARLAEIAARKA
ncbi:MAG: transcription-repair coupling factor [Rhizobiales bacterium]|nr:transcription-repair coupling factor [Hyphomicrobiales bacterium]